MWNEGISDSASLGQPICSARGVVGLSSGERNEGGWAGDSDLPEQAGDLGTTLQRVHFRLIYMRMCASPKVGSEGTVVNLKGVKSRD